MFHFVFAEIAQVRLPLPILDEIFGDMLREQNVSRIATIHDPFRHVNSRTGDVRLLVHIRHAADRATVDPHPELELRMKAQSSSDLHRTSNRGFGTGEEDERHSVAGRQSHEFACRLGHAELLSASDDLIQLLLQLALIIDQQFGVTD